MSISSSTSSAAHMPLAIFGGVQIFGGPYPYKPEGLVGVKMAAEIDLPCQISVPTQDYQTPDPAQLERGLIQAAGALAKGHQLYVGCMGGIGRTGLFMACLAKAAGVAQPVQWVREHYNGHAVETEQQMAFVHNFDTTAVTRRLTKLGAFAPVASIASDNDVPKTAGLLSRVRSSFSR